MTNGESLDGRHPLAPIAARWEWQESAACRGMSSDVFFHPPNERAAGRRRRIAVAKAVCRICPVVQECLDHALDVVEAYGIWGGRSEEERAAMILPQSPPGNADGRRARPLPRSAPTEG